MREIAEAAGVSQATVSMALRGHPRVARATTERIRQLAEEMGYRPDPYVSTLMSRVHRGRRGDESPVLAAIDVDGHLATSLSITAFLRGAERRAAALGFDLQTFAVTCGNKEQKALHRQLQARGVRGLLVLPVKQTSRLELPWEHYAVSVLGYFEEWMNFHRANADHFGNVRLMLTCLQEMGYRRIAMILPRALEARNQYRRTAAFLVSAPVPSPDLIGYSDDPDFQPGKWLRAEKPDLIIASNADDLRKRLAEGGKMQGDFPEIMPLHLPPNDLEPEGPGLDSRPSAVGAAGLDLVVAQIHRNETGVPPAPKLVTVPGHWVGR